MLSCGTDGATSIIDHKHNSRTICGAFTQLSTLTSISAQVLNDAHPNELSSMMSHIDHHLPGSLTRSLRHCTSLIRYFLRLLSNTSTPSATAHSMCAFHRQITSFSVVILTRLSKVRSVQYLVHRDTLEDAIFLVSILDDRDRRRCRSPPKEFRFVTAFRCSS